MAAIPAPCQADRTARQSGPLQRLGAEAAEEQHRGEGIVGNVHAHGPGRRRHGQRHVHRSTVPVTNAHNSVIAGCVSGLPGARLDEVRSRQLRILSVECRYPSLSQLVSDAVEGRRRGRRRAGNRRADDVTAGPEGRPHVQVPDSKPASPTHIGIDPRERAVARTDLERNAILTGSLLDEPSRSRPRRLDLSFRRNGDLDPRFSSRRRLVEAARQGNRIADAPGEWQERQRGQGDRTAHGFPMAVGRSIRL